MIRYVAFTPDNRTKLDGTEAGAQVNDVETVLNTDTSTADMQFVIDEDTMISDSPTKVPTQQSVKKYVDNNIVATLNYKGGYDAANNIPDLDVSPSGVSLGDFYTVTSNGMFFTASVSVGDAIIAETDNATALTDWTVLNRNLDAATIKFLYESNLDTNVFDDDAESKLGGIEAGAEVNNISDVNATGLTDGGETTLHSHAAPAGTYAGIYRLSVGNQKIKNVIELLDFNASGPSNGAVVDIGNDKITVPTSGDYNIVFSGSAKIKKDVLYSFSIVINGGSPIALGNIESAADNYLRTFSYAMMYTLAANDEVQPYAINDSGTDKDFYMQIGTSFTIVKL